RWSWGDDDLAEDLAVFHHAHGLAGLGEREDAVDDRLDAAALHLDQQRFQILPRPAVGADDVHLAAPDVADVGLRVEAGGGPAGQQAAVPGQRAEARHPGVAARVVHE